MMPRQLQDLICTFKHFVGQGRRCDSVIVEHIVSGTIEMRLTAPRLCQLASSTPMTTGKDVGPLDLCPHVSRTYGIEHEHLHPENGPAQNDERFPGPAIQDLHISP
jgi:hypothetical protein